jgi:hypothetical protein
VNDKLHTPWIALRFGIGLTAALAGFDKFFNLLADWGSYISPAIAGALPLSSGAFLEIVGVIELAVGVAILTGWTRVGAYVASAWLLGVAANLIVAGFYDVAVRDVVMAIGAFTLARLAEIQQPATVQESAAAPARAGRQVTA